MPPIKEVLLITLILGVLVAGCAIFAGMFGAIRLYYQGRIFNWLQKRKGRTFFIVTGSPEVVAAAHEVCVSTIERVQSQFQKRSEGIGVNDGQQPVAQKENEKN